MTKLHLDTPLIQSLSINNEIEANIWLKMEALQPCGSFKARGIGHACKQYIAGGATKFISSSGGNAGLAVAYSGRCLGIPVTVVVPKTTKKEAIELIKLQDAEVIINGENWNEAHLHALSLIKENSAYIHPYDDPYIWEGHATVIDEISSAGVSPDAVILSVGGGGLLCGAVQGLKRNGLEKVPVLAVETYGAESLYAAAKAKKHIAIDRISSIATSLGAKKVAKRAFELLDEHPVFHQLVTDRDAIDGCNRFS